MVLKRMIYKFPWYIFDLLLLYPLGHGRDHLEYTPFHPSIVCANFGWNWPSGPREDICQYIFYIKLSYPFRKTGSFIYFIHNLVKIGNAVLERNFFYLVHVFSLFCFYLPLEKDVALYLNRHEFPLFKDALHQVWSKMALWVWRRKFENFVKVCLLFCYYLSFENVKALHFFKIGSPLPKK